MFNKIALSSILCFLFLSSNDRLSAQDVHHGLRQTLLFNEGWKFHKGDIINAEHPNFADKDWLPVDLPHDWSIDGPFDQQWASGTAYLPAGIGWYRKTFRVGAALINKPAYIYFDGVYDNSEVWINGHSLGKRPNGFIPFQYELTKYLFTGENTIAVKVDHSEFADSRWYTGSGIYRNVYLITTGSVSIDLWGVGFSTPQVSPEQATAKLKIALTNRSAADAGITVKAVLLDPAGQQVALAQQSLGKIKAGAGASADLILHAGNPSLWSVDHPSLYTLEVSLSANGKETDHLAQKVGLRFFKFDKDKGFSLNGQTMKLKGVCIHDDAGALGVAVPAEAWERRLRILKAGGCNSLRLSHNPHADYLYDLCDKLGFLVMDEAFDEWEVGKNKWIKGWNVGKPGQDGYHQYFKEWANRDLGDMIRCHRNHPSIILWSIGNEIDYPNDPYTDPILDSGRNPQIYGKGYLPDHPAARRLTEIGRQLVAVVRQYDTTRPVTAALAGVVMSNIAGYPEVLDVVGYNYQEYRYADDHKKYPDRIIFGSENGMQLDAWKAVADNDYIAGQYLWTGVDYMGEARSWPGRSSAAGLIDLAGFKKPEYYFRQSLWSDKPMVYIGAVPTGPTAGDRATDNARSRRDAIPAWNYSQGDSVRVDCYTNCDEAELTINGKSLGRRSPDPASGRILRWNVVYEPGTLSVKGYNKGRQVASFGLATAGEPYAIKAGADLGHFSPGPRQTTNVEIDIVDQKGNSVYNAENEISVGVEGPAKLLGLESGSLVSHEDYRSNKRMALHGKLLAYIQSLQKPGTVKITISSPGLRSQEIILDGIDQGQLTLSNKQASPEAVALYKYIQDMYGKKILSGQMVSGWGFDELKYIQDSTGKLPAIRGMDFIDSAQNENQVRFAREWWQRGGIPTIMWHWGAPGIGGGYVNSKKEVDIDKCFQPGTREYMAFWKELKEKAALLKELEKAHIPVLWRPFHELNGDWFWWGKKGPAQFKRLWITMYDYFVNKEKLNNLIWVLCYSGKPDSAWYPGREYVDIAGADTYGPSSPHKEMYAAVASIVGNRMPITFHECGTPPDPVECMEQGARWSWFMEWHTDHLRKLDPAYLRIIYSNDLIITLDKVPDIMAAYGNLKRKIVCCKP